MSRMRRWILWSLLLLLASPGLASGFSHLMTGMELPSVDGEGIDGSSVHLSDHTGKRATVVLFWATWSDNSLPALRRLASYKASITAGDLGVVSVNVEAQAPSAEELARVERLVAGEHLPFPVILDRGLVRFHDFGVVAVPSAILLDGEGRVAELLIGYPLVGRDTFFRHLDELLGKAPKAVRPTTGVKLLPKEAIRLTRLAQRLLVRDRRKIALEKLAQAERIAPDFLPAYRLAARIHLASGEAEAAAAAARHCLSTLPDDPECLLLAARAKVAQKDVAGARAQLGQCVEHHPDYAGCVAFLGRLEVEAGEHQKGLDRLTRALALNPLDPEIQEALGEGRVSAGDEKGGAEALRRAVEIRMGGRLGTP